MEQGLRVVPTKVRELGHVPTSSCCSLAEGCALGHVNSPVLWPPMGEQSEPLGTEKSLGKKSADAGRWKVQGNVGGAPTKSATINYHSHFKDKEIEK